MERNSMLLAFIATILAFMLNLYLIPFLISLARKKNWFDDSTDKRKIHSGEISRLGGIGIILSFVAATAAAILGISRWIPNILFFSLGRGHSSLLILTGCILVFLIGLLDDFANLKARYKLLGQIAASLLVILGGAGIRSVNIPFSEIHISLGPAGPLLTLIWLVGMSNAVNLIDGMDGLSAGICAVTAFVYSIVFLLEGQFFLAIICYTLLGSIIGYLFYNFPPARIFMGDSGSLTLGFILALMPILAFPARGESLVMPVTMLAIPIGDVFAALIRRKRNGKPFFTPDQAHMHHKLLDMGRDERQILALVLGIQIFSGFSVILFEKLPGIVRYIPVSISLILVLGLFITLHYWYHSKKNDSINGAAQKDAEKREK